MKSFKYQLMIVLLSFLCCQSAFAASGKDVSKELFLEKYNNWLEWKNTWEASKNNISSHGNPAYGEQWVAIIDLGVDALPYIIEYMHNEPLLVSAFIDITGISLTDKVDTRKCRDSKCFFNTNIDYIEKWWNDDRKRLDEDIQKDIKQYLSLRTKSNSKYEYDMKLYHIIRDYGVFLLPYLNAELDKGNVMFSSTVLELLRHFEKDTNKNMELYRIETSNISDTEKAKKARDFINNNKSRFSIDNEARIIRIKDFIEKYKNKK